jgi:hypothetical protein
MKPRTRRRFDERALKLVLAAFFVALAVPAGILIAQAYSQLKWQAFRSSQVAAEELAARIDGALRAATATEDARSFGDYSFLVVEGDAAANFVQRSPLSVFPVAGAVPGVLGWFQIDAGGTLTTPLLPGDGVAAADYGITPAEETARAERVTLLREVLARNELVRAVRPERDDAGASALEQAQQFRLGLDAEPPAAPPSAAAQAGFDRLAAEAEQSAAGAAPASAVANDLSAAQEIVVTGARRARTLEERQGRVEQSLVAEPAVDEAADAEQPKAELAIRTFASEVDPFELGVLDTGHLVLFRNVWR